MSYFEDVIQKEKGTDNKDSVILSIVIPSYNGANLLLRCLNALENQTAKKKYFEMNFKLVLF